MVKKTNYSADHRIKKEW